MKKMMIEVRGKHKRWSFGFYGDPQYLEEWRADGLEVNVVENTFPLWVADWGLVRPWCFVQDIINLRNPFR